MKVIIAAVLGFFFGLETGYVWAHGAPEAPQTWAVVAGVLAVLLVITLAIRGSNANQG